MVSEYQSEEYILSKLKRVGFLFSTVAATIFVVWFAYGADDTTIIGENISTGGTLTVTGTSQFSGSLLASSTVQISGTTTLYGLLVSSGTATSTFANGLSLSAGCFRMPDGTCAGAGGATGTAGQIPFFAASGSTLTATSTLFISTAGKVGIGTTTPNEALTVRGNISALATSRVNPLFVGSANTVTLPLNVYVSGTYAYVSRINGSNGVLEIFDVSNASSPTAVGSTTTSGQPSGLFVSGRYAYIGSSNGQIQIYDVSKSSAPSLVGSVAGNSSGSILSVNVSGRYAYALYNDGVFNNGSIEIFDISDPSSPVSVGTVGTGNNPFAFHVVGRYAYVAVNSTGLKIFDISNPSAPVLVGSVSVSNPPETVRVSGRRAYVRSSDGTLRIFDISNPAIPTQVSYISAGTGDNSSGIQIFVSGRYAFVKSYSDNTLQVFDVASSTAPILVGTATTGSGPNSLFVSGRYAYIVNNDDKNLQIFDVGGLETTSALVHSLESGNVQVRNDLLVQNQVQITGGLNVGSGGIFSAGPLSVGIASSTQSGAVSAFFQGRLGVGTTSPSQLLSVQGNALFSGNLALANLTATGTIGIGTSTPTESFATNGRLYVGGSGTSTIENNLKVLGNLQIGAGSITISSTTVNLPGSLNNLASTVANPTSRGSASTGSTPSSVYVSGRYAYVVNAGSATLQVFDVSTSSPALVGSASTGVVPRSVFVSGRYAYVVNANSGTLQIFDVSNPASPVVLGSASTGSVPISVFVSGRYAYVVNAVSNTIQIFDVSNPASPVVVGSASTDTSPRSVYVSGRYAYVVNGTSATLQIFDVSNPASPVVLGSAAASAGTSPRSVYVSGRYAYVVNDAGSLSTFQIFDVSNPASPVVVGSASTGSTPSSVYVSGRYAYVLNLTSNTLQVFDVSNPVSPVVVGSATVAGSASSASSPRSVHVSGRYAYLVNEGSATLQVFDVSGLETTSAIVHSLETGNLQVRNDILAHGQAQITGGLSVGNGGIFSAGPLSVGIASSTQSGAVSAFFQGNVGIGTTTPPQPLSVQGNALFSGNLSLANLTSTGTLTVGGTGTSTLVGGLQANALNIVSTSASSTFANGVNLTAGCFSINGTCVGGGGGGSGIVGAATLAGQVPYYASASDTLTATSTLFISTASRVGIGTTTPRGLLGLNDPGGTDSFVIGSGTPRLIVKEGGNIGIGTFNPSYKLQVAGNIGPSAAPASTTVSQTLTSVDTTGSVGEYTSIAIGTDGLPVISYYDSTNSALKVAKCGNAACSSGTTLTTVETGNLMGRSTSIAIGIDGFPVISYHEAGTGTLKVAKCGNAACSSGNTLTSVDAPSATTGKFTSIAIGADGLPVVSYWSGAGGALKVAKCGNASCSSGNTLTTIDSPGGGVDLATSIAIGTDGLPVISYYDSTNTALKVAKCGNAACSSGNTLTSVDAPNITGQDNSIAIGTDGLPVISYASAGAGTVRVAKCGNAACSSGNTLTTVDSSGDPQFTAIAIGTDGLPVISFYDNNTGVNDLKVIKCGNTACSSGNTSTTIDATNNTGKFTSIAIGADGLPVISYRDETNADLKVARCANAACSSTAGNVFTGGSLLGGWMSNPRSYSAPFQSLSTIQISNPTTFQNLSFLTAGSERLTITPSGKIGIGTTSPMAKLSVVGNIAVTGCVQSATSTFNLTSATTCADVAESYLSSEPVEPGDLLMLDQNQAGSVKKAQMTNGSMTNNLLMGVVSSNPAIIIEGSGLQLMTNSSYTSDPNKPAVALAGRVPVKVNLEGGDIQIGDPITISSQAGIGKKATSSGKIIGYALENYTANDQQQANNGQTTADSHKIMLFANLTYYQANPVEASDDANGASNSSLIALALEAVKSWLADMQVVVEQGLVKVKALVAETFQAKSVEVGSSENPAGVTVYDLETKEPYCIVVRAGQMQNIPGKCNSENSSANGNANQETANQSEADQTNDDADQDTESASEDVSQTEDQAENDVVQTDDVVADSTVEGSTE